MTRKFELTIDRTLSRIESRMIAHATRRGIDITRDVFDATLCVYDSCHERVAFHVKCRGDIANVLRETRTRVASLVHDND